MESQVVNNNERTRTYWTPTMERYFVDLMLEHLQKGNRIGYTFNKQAWSDMLAVFNANFGSQYDKDVLKSRYTNLWKHFKDVNILIGQDGFSWDEARTMVVADDSVWDAYLKAHPDARLYKTKPVQNFSALCMIFGYTTADGRYSRSSHDMDVDDEVNGVSLGDGPGSTTPSTTEHSRTEWTLAMDQFFTELLLGQLKKGNKLDSNSSTTREVWTEMLNVFNEKFGPHHTKRVLRHRYKKLFKYYTDIKVLLKQDGFSWDLKEQKVVAKDDVWDAYIKAYSQARSYRAKSMPNFKDLESIFESAIFNGSRSNNLVEDVGAKTGSHRSRTHWTPPMDRYLIDLLLGQVNRGNRIGQTFVAQAWIDMVNSFNANFSSHHDKDVLKNRYKQLKKQYNDIHTLLGAKGFSWDDAREMVAAEDHVWDSYIEAHPDARSYRIKTVPSYHKLCVVYGQNSSEGQYSHLARTVSVSSTGESNTSSSSEAQDNWTSEMDECFIELMLEQHKGKIVHGFDDQVWTMITSSFNERCKVQYDNQALQDRYAYFMKQFNEVKFLINQNGFSWDDTCQMVVANDEEWEAMSKEHPYATLYKGTVLRHHTKLSVIFGGFSAKTLTTNSDTSVDMETDTIDKNLQILPKEPKTVNRKKRVKKSQLASVCRGKVQKNQSDDLKEAFTDMANVVSKLVSVETDKNYSGAIEKAVDALQAIPDIDDDLLLDGCDILEDEKKAQTFLALDVSLRKKWLLRKLRH
uniref:L10-interacting MYB domain-containing protein-like n=1 Tax=Erigeron canadensis TaxID=72917 RepID=UPI001CB8F84A|nr:L10-interacting MYB domain-containing protein-like [Erigeron canadensis]XP_043627370.1 L10-interacting MYB domain-containing protein-like [Erigeron canadensis]